MLTRWSGTQGIERYVVRVQQTLGVSLTENLGKIIDVDEKKEWRENAALRYPRRGVEGRRCMTLANDGEGAICQKGTNPFPGAAVHTGFVAELQQQTVMPHSIEGLGNVEKRDWKIGCFAESGVDGALKKKEVVRGGKSFPKARLTRGEEFSIVEVGAQSVEHDSLKRTGHDGGNTNQTIVGWVLSVALTFVQRHSFATFPLCRKLAASPGLIEEERECCMEGGTGVTKEFGVYVV